MLSLDMSHNSALITALNHGSTFTQADSDLNKKIRKTCDKVTENLYSTANEPLLGCYRIQEHVAKTVPTLLNKMIEMEKTDSKLRGLLYDVEYSSSSIGTVRDSKVGFESIELLLKRSIYLKQQIDYDNSVRKRLSERAALEQRDKHANNQEDQLLDNDLERRLHLNNNLRESPSNQTTNDNSTNNRSNGADVQSSSRHSFASNTTNATKNAFNRFSTSFDFRNFPVSDLRNDFKSFISQFTTPSNQRSSSGGTGIPEERRNSSGSAGVAPPSSSSTTQTQDCDTPTVKSDVLNCKIEEFSTESQNPDHERAQSPSILKQT